MNTTITAELTRLLAKQDKLLMESARHTQLNKDLAEEEERKLKAADLNGPEKFREISDLRLKRELCEGKPKEFQDAADALQVEIAEVCQKLRDYLLENISAKTATLVGEIASRLEPHFAGRDGAARDAALQSFGQTNFARSIRRTEDRLRSNGLFDRPVRSTAAELIEMAGVIENANILQATAGDDPAPISAEQLEAEELKNLLADPEPAVVSKMKHGLTREKAETAVKGRVTLLQAKLAAPGQAAEQLKEIEANPKKFVQKIINEQDVSQSDAEVILARHTKGLRTLAATATPPTDASETSNQTAK
ncbi:MAG: hypothetical protein WBW41_14805 [Verrucomicrobiia bacterium]